MMTQNEQKKHLEYFANQPTIILSDVLKNISSGKIIPDSDSDLDQASKALLKLLIDGRKLKLSENEFLSHIPVSFSEDMKKTLRTFYTTETSIKDLLNSDEYSFRDLEFRLEAKIASRFCDSLPVEPKIVMKIHLDQEKSLKHRLSLSDCPSTKRELLIQTDANSLIHIIEQLESAKTAISGRKFTINS